MYSLVLPFWLFVSIFSGEGMEPAHARNFIYTQALQSGFPAGDSPLKLPAPVLGDGLDAAQQRAALLELMGSENALADLLRDSVTAPFLLKVHDQKTKEATIRIVDLWFVVRGDLERVDPVEIANQASGKAVEAGNMRFESRLLTDADLRPRGQSNDHGRELSRWFVHLESRLLDRVTVEATNESVATSSRDSMVIAACTAPVFDSDPRFANRWRNIDKDGQPGPEHPYPGGLSYTKISRLKQPEGALLIEFHAVFNEPEAWFQGAPILRSKFAPIAQNQVRKLRRELLKNRAKPAALPADSR